MQLPIEYNTPIKDSNGKYHLCRPVLIAVKGGKNVAYITQDGAEIVREPVHRYKNRISRRKCEQPAQLQDNEQKVFIPEKERLIVQQLRDFINEDSYTIALVSGIRKVGKTTALRQLEQSYPGAVFIDLTRSDTGFSTIKEALSNNNTKLLLLDEFSQLDDFDSTAQYIHDMSAATDRIIKVIMTGSSAAHITMLRRSKLGGGRARLFRLPPVLFIEYLYMTGKIPNYIDYSAVRNEHFTDYLTLEGLTQTLKIQFDSQYFSDFYEDVFDGNKKSSLTSSLIDLEYGDLQAMADIIAYKLSEARKYTKVISPDVGQQEFRNIQLRNKQQGEDLFDNSCVDLSSAFMTISKDRVGRPISPTDKGRILSFLLLTGLANMEVTKQDDVSKQIPAHDMLGLLKSATTDDDLAAVFKKASICLISPLFYTRLGKDIYERAGVDPDGLFTGGRLLGMMLEVYIRGKLAMHKVDAIMTSTKLDYPGLGEVDIYDESTGLLCEISSYNKEENNIYIQNYFKDTTLIRICSSWDKTGIHNGVLHIPYAKLCCAIDTGEVFDTAALKSLE